MSQFDFSEDVPAEAVYYTLPLKGEPPPELLVRYAGEANRAYSNALLKANQKSGVSRRLARGQATVDTQKKLLDIDRDLFPRHVILGWRHVVNKKKEQVEYSHAACRELLEALPDWAMRELSQFCGIATNFTKDSEPDESDIEDTAGN